MRSDYFASDMSMIRLFKCLCLRDTSILCCKTGSARIICCSVGFAICLLIFNKTVSSLELITDSPRWRPCAFAHESFITVNCDLWLSHSNFTEEWIKDRAHYRRFTSTKFAVEEARSQKEPSPRVRKKLKSNIEFETDSVTWCNYNSDYQTQFSVYISVLFWH